MPTRTREIHLAARPHGEPTESDFRMVTTELPDPGPGEVLVRNLVMSVDPYMRGRMNDRPSYAPPWQVGEPARGGAVGEVLAGDGLPAGTLVLHDAGWREHALLRVGEVRQVEPVAGVPASYYLGALGMPGLTAYAGLFHIARLQPGDTVFVSGAAGAVGGIVGQLARLRGAKRVIGSAGSAEKVRFVTETLGFDAAFDYHDGPIAELLKAAAPEGIDVYFDNVGGEHLEAAIATMNVHGRIALCGSISGYNATGRPYGVTNLGLAVGRRLSLTGFLVSDHENLRPEFAREVGAWVRSGEIKVTETSVDGLDNAVSAFIGMLNGRNTGKMIVRLT
ncbi:NADP-dependent oxidoreductase [Microtetraspora sp. NBRC 13810]|uniref:NADP-dependent oxidoreductase n=1 Tax=Microtetraspora sp. NBRC 13810 TaxID=3030990 RepID=UPI0024A21555|nr:NADP-dependent oxidoreductase [Microtetraspora sp. NBRC 13810]GLW12365.1 NADP-dependent oxidoreductase [Microtetraspora sp. NBRC 13810]